MKVTTRDIAGNITIVKDVEISKENKCNLLQAKKITEMPKGLKRRHPIYGKGKNSNVKFSLKHFVYLIN